MPELPEIETVRKVIGPQVEGCRIVSASCDREKMIVHPSSDELPKLLEGRIITSSGRRGKGLILNLDDGSHLIIRFGMTGQLIVVPDGYPEEKHTHLILDLADGRHVWYIDPRMFGKICLIRSGEEDVYSGLQKLGPEPFDECLDWKYLKTRIGDRSASIKESLMDQSVVAGIGNIWADEMLYRCKICPEMPCNRISDRRWKLLAHTIPEVMEFGIEKNAVTMEEYLKGKGREYYDIHYLEAYGHEGQTCPRCGKVFVRTVLGGRSSYWCPGCQKKR